MKTLVSERHLFIMENAEKFQRIFNYSISRFYNNPFLGFNIVKFDEQVIKSPDGISMRDTIINRYGAEAADLIKKLIA